MSLVLKRRGENRGERERERERERDEDEGLMSISIQQIVHLISGPEHLSRIEFDRIRRFQPLLISCLPLSPPSFSSDAGKEAEV